MLQKYRDQTTPKKTGRDDKIIEIINYNQIVDVFRETNYDKKVYSFFKTDNKTKKIIY